MTATGRTQAPTGAAAFIAREKGRSSRGSRSLAVSAIVVVALGAGLGVWTAASDGAAQWNAQPATVPTTPTAADPTAERRAAERLAAEKRDLQTKEIAENQKRIAALERRREELQKQVAELTAPLSADLDEARQDTARPGDRAKPATSGPVGGAPAKIGNAEVGELPLDVAAVARPEDRAAAPVAAPQTEAPAAANGPVRVFIHVRARDPEARARAEALAENLRRRGVDVAGIRGVPRAVRNDMVRFFYDADQNAVSELERALESASRGGGAPITQDFRNRRVAPKPGTLEIWLS